MTNVVEFPTPEDHSWSKNEAWLLKLFTDHDVPETVQRRVLHRVREAFFVNPYTISFQAIDPEQLPEPLRSNHLETIAQIRAQYSKVMTYIVAERVAAELRFCRELDSMP